MTINLWTFAKEEKTELTAQSEPILLNGFVEIQQQLRLSIDVNSHVVLCCQSGKNQNAG